ncbi:phage integrase N-terminal SAM-like domain-containing protein [Streptomyces misionensis]
MLEGWARQQRTRFLDWESTIRPRVSLVKRLARFTNQYPWQREPAEVEAFFDYLRTRRPGKPLAVSTARNYQNDLRLFLDYVTDARYGWPTTCSERFDRAPVQLLHEWNTVTHTSEYECAAERRKRGALDYQPDSQHNTVALPRPGTRTTHPVRIPRPTATTSRLRRPRQPQQRPSCPGLRPAGIRPRRPHHHKHQQRHTVDRIRQTRLARLHRVPHADLTAPRSTAMDQRDHHELGAVIAPLYIRRQMRRADE